MWLAGAEHGLVSQWGVSIETPRSALLGLLTALSSSKAKGSILDVLRCVLAIPLQVLDFFQCHISCLNPFVDVRLSYFTMACRAYGGKPTLSLFRSLFTLRACPLFGSVGLLLGGFSLAFGYLDQWSGDDFERLPLILGESSCDMALSPVFTWRHTRFIGSLASSEEGEDVDPFLLSYFFYLFNLAMFVVAMVFTYLEYLLCNNEAQESHDILSGLYHSEAQRQMDGLFLNELANFHDVSTLKFTISSTMLNREALSLSAEVLRLRSEVFDLKSRRSKSATTIARMEAKLLGVVGRSSVGEAALVRDLKIENKKLLEEKEDIMLVTEASLKTELERKAMLVIRAQALEEVVGMGVSLQFEAIKDYDLDAVEEPPSIPLCKSSGVVPYSSPFI
uniref:Uncharacterized protein n=1 Tax=Tanacetum cinerariifolium TaxID=118510 RepID=A0A6L2L9A1_TANCI|nr:hypothetical protein [Tanacetum cinerariifolium]